MEEKKSIYDNLDLNTSEKKTSFTKKTDSKQGMSRYLLILTGVLIFFLVTITILFNSFSSDSNSSAAGQNTFDIESETVKSAAIRFLTRFYWYNRDSYMDMRRELEKMMTTSMLAQYKKEYYDPKFENEIKSSYMLIHMDYDRILYRKEGDSHLARIVGFITYENARTGSKIRRSATWTLTIVKEEGQYLIQNFNIQV